ncbi:aminotransferase class I/II-fold pyridoxal phosphate-dependent enzyme [Halosquirtibacter laminarini]|uniref:Aminotransferase class I/II-fold pyridoxal phosphate-dependent enzyme n=2 Tax=Halosquirtibacter laminarini TaxID=3374600 RepID=A0AC61NPX1_9BACT|nr:aminotransferase class I/II-fold pyridoxal phosphate-dependent enzyme [Prolixibacteraceae bacterium]
MQARLLKEADMYPYFKEISSNQSDTSIIDGKEVLMFGSNNYLGLNNHPEVKEASIQAIKKYGTSCTGSRFMNGTIDLHHKLENELAEWLGKERTIVFPTGFQVNTGVIPAMVGKNDYILIDELDHASIIDGCRMSMAQRIKYRHNSPMSLEQKLNHISSKKGTKLIVTDGIFSMDGDIARLDKIVEVAKKHDAFTFVDCAHAIGVIGNHGAGTSSHYGVTDEVDLIGGTFSKSLASVGGFVAGSNDIIEYLNHASRTYMFSASLPPSSTASALATLRVIRSDDSHRLRLWDNTLYAIRCMKEIGFDIGMAETPIIPIYVRDSVLTFQIARDILKRGIYVNPVVAPGVKENDALLRFSLTAVHTKEQIDFAIENIAAVLKEHNILKGELCQLR